MNLNWRQRAWLFIFPFIVTPQAVAQVSLSISSTFSAIAYTNAGTLSGDENETFELPHPPLKDSYVLVARIAGGSLDIIAFDRINVERNEPNPTFLLNSKLTSSSAVIIPQSTSGRGVVVSLINDSGIAERFQYTVFRIGTRSPSVRTQLEKVIQVPLTALSKFYRMPKFTVSVEPCGTVNAFSSPNIVLCSELISDLHEKDMIYALYPILYHELAHTLLRMWNLPGYDNEDLADEFAAAMLARVAPERIQTFIDYLESNDSTMEAIVQLTEGSKHSLSIQRARNMRSALNNVNELEARWGQLLKPFQVNSRSSSENSQWLLLGRHAGAPTYYRRPTVDDTIVNIWLKKGRLLNHHVRVDCSNHKMRYLSAHQESKMVPLDTEWHTPGSKYGEWVYSEICSKFISSSTD